MSKKEKTQKAIENKKSEKKSDGKKFNNSSSVEENVKSVYPYWTEPEPIDKNTWVTKQYGEEDKLLKSVNHKSKQDATHFLNTINIYIDDKIAYSGI